MTSSRFREKFLAALEHVARSMTRVVVGELPAEVLEWRESNRRALNLCRDGLSEDEQEAILTFFNARFGNGWVHYCCPNCCQGNEDFRACLVCEEFLSGTAVRRFTYFR